MSQADVEDPKSQLIEENNKLRDRERELQKQVNSMLEAHGSATEQLRKESMLYKQKFEELKEMHNANTQALAGKEKEL